MSISPLLNYKKTKYVILDAILKPHLPKRRSFVNLIIDINSVYNSLYNPQLSDLFSTMNVAEKYDLASDLLNLVGHYRHYFANRCQLYSNIILYFSRAKSSYHMIINKNYRSDYYDKHTDNVSFKILNDMIQKNVDIAKVISEYIPHTYCLNIGDIDTTFFPYRLIKLRKMENDTNIILSNDELTVMNMNSQNTFVLSAKSDKSKLITNYNINSWYTTSKKVLEDEKSNFIILNYKSFLQSAIGFKDRFEGLKGYNRLTIYKYIAELIDKNELSLLNPPSIDQFIKIFKSYSLFNSDQSTLFRKNFLQVDAQTIYDNSAIFDSSFNNAFLNKIDASTLRKINSEYFRNNPIDLDFLMEGEEY
jgi:hypothetical protein